MAVPTPAAPYDPFPMITSVAILLSTPAGQAILNRMLLDAGISQADLEAEVAGLAEPEDPA